MIATVTPGTCSPAKAPDREAAGQVFRQTLLHCILGDWSSFASYRVAVRERCRDQSLLAAHGKRDVKPTEASDCEEDCSHVFFIDAL